jgi:hypothetical protein
VKLVTGTVEIRFRSHTDASRGMETTTRRVAGLPEWPPAAHFLVLLRPVAGEGWGERLTFRQRNSPLRSLRGTHLWTTGTRLSWRGGRCECHGSKRSIERSHRCSN